MKIKLTVGEVAQLEKLVNSIKSRGGFQNLLLYLWYHLDEDTGELELDYNLAERINRYAFHYKNVYWRRTLRKLFRRTLGANLDRALTLR